MDQQQKVSEYLGYSGGKGYVWVAIIVILMIGLTANYIIRYHNPDYANWNVKNPDADKIIWQAEKKIDPNMNK